MAGFGQREDFTATSFTIVEPRRLETADAAARMRSWHEDTGLGPADHPLLQPDPHDWDFTDLSRDQAKEVDARYLVAAAAESDTVVEEAA